MPAGNRKLDTLRLVGRGQIESNKRGQMGRGSLAAGSGGKGWRLTLSINRRLILSMVVCALLACNHVQAKTHHSKRHAPATSGHSQQDLQKAASTTGHFEPGNNNWWNLWWQQYINDAIQPEVMPVEAVRFAGKTIALAPEEPDDVRPNQSNRMELDRNVRFLNQADNQQQQQFQSQGKVNKLGKPFQEAGPSDQFGIQMRGSPALRQPASRASSTLANSNNNNQQQQQNSNQDSYHLQQAIEELSKIEQMHELQQQNQQHQLTDFSEEPEPELEVNQLGGDTSGSSSSANFTDSSSSNMMAPETVNNPSGNVVLMTNSMNQETTVRTKPELVTSSNDQNQNQELQREQATRPSSGGLQINKQQEQSSSTGMQTYTSKAQPEVTSPAITEASSPQKILGNAGRESSSSTTTTTTTTNPSSGNREETTPNGNNNIDNNFGGRTSASGSTPATAPQESGLERESPARVELINGRPSSGGQRGNQLQQQGTTTSSRLPTKARPATSPSMSQTTTPSSFASSSSATSGTEQSTSGGANSNTPSANNKQQQQQSSSTPSVSSATSNQADGRKQQTSESSTTVSTPTQTSGGNPEAVTISNNFSTNQSSNKTAKSQQETTETTTGSPPEATEASDDGDDNNNTEQPITMDDNGTGNDTDSNNSDVDDSDDTEDTTNSTSSSSSSGSVTETPIDNFTTTTSTSTRAPASSSETNRKQQKDSNELGQTTANSMMANMEIERVPASSSGSAKQTEPAKSSKLVESEPSSEVNSAKNNDKSSSNSSDSAMVDIKSPQSATMSTMVMVNLSDATSAGSATAMTPERQLDEASDSAITMPMDVLMRMVMMSRQSDADLTRTTPKPLPTSEPTMGTGNQNLAGSANTGSQREAATVKSTSAPPTQASSTSMMKQAAGQSVTTQLDRLMNQQDQADVQRATTKMSQIVPTTTTTTTTTTTIMDVATTKRRPNLQPPPTTASPPPSSQTNADQASMMSMGQQAVSMIMDSLQGPSDGPGKMIFSGQQQPKIELLDQDMMPIQRNNFTSSTTSNSMSSGSETPITLQRQQQQQSMMQRPARPEVPMQQQQQQTTKQMSTGQQMTSLPPDFVMPGMRLKPLAPVQQTMTMRQQQQQQQVMMNQPSPVQPVLSNNQVYMIMMPGGGDMPALIMTETHTKRPQTGEPTQEQQQRTNPPRPPAPAINLTPTMPAGQPEVGQPIQKQQQQQQQQQKSTQAPVQFTMTTKGQPMKQFTGSREPQMQTTSTSRQPASQPIGIITRMQQQQRQQTTSTSSPTGQQQSTSGTKRVTSGMASNFTTSRPSLMAAITTLATQTPLSTGSGRSSKLIEEQPARATEMARQQATMTTASLALSTTQSNGPFTTTNGQRAPSSLAEPSPPIIKTTIAVTGSPASGQPARMTQRELTMMRLGMMSQPEATSTPPPAISGLSSSGVKQQQQQDASGSDSGSASLGTSTTGRVTMMTTNGQQAPITTTLSPLSSTSTLASTPTPASTILSSVTSPRSQNNSVPERSGNLRLEDTMATTTMTTNTNQSPISPTSGDNNNKSTTTTGTASATTTTTATSGQTSSGSASANEQPTTTTMTITTTTSSASPVTNGQQSFSRPPEVVATTVSNKPKQSENSDASRAGGSQVKTPSGTKSGVSIQGTKGKSKTWPALTAHDRNSTKSDSAVQSPSNQLKQQQQHQVATNPSASASQTAAALRQFGGSNRMSVLANAPVPFGRPSSRFEVPTFEYGPSISVRRPDEPLANGQMPNCTLTGKNFCVLTKDYPMNAVRQAVERSFRSVRIMYEELQTVSDQELHREDFANATSSQAASGKFACQTSVELMRPGWARDEITKEWMLVVNTDVFPQRVRTESCAQPNTPCEFIAPFYDSTCQQRYSLHRMIAIDPHDPSRSPQVAVFKFPAGCVCRVHPIKKTPSPSTSSTPSMTPIDAGPSSSSSRSPTMTTVRS